MCAVDCTRTQRRREKKVGGGKNWPFFKTWLFNPFAGKVRLCTHVVVCNRQTVHMKFMCRVIVLAALLYFPFFLPTYDSNVPLWNTSVPYVGMYDIKRTRKRLCLEVQMNVFSISLASLRKIAKNNYQYVPSPTGTVYWTTYLVSTYLLSTARTFITGNVYSVPNNGTLQLFD